MFCTELLFLIYIYKGLAGALIAMICRCELRAPAAAPSTMEEMSEKWVSDDEGLPLLPRRVGPWRHIILLIVPRLSASLNPPTHDSRRRPATLPLSGSGGQTAASGFYLSYK